MQRKKQKPIRVLFPYVGDTIGGSHISSLTLVRALNRDEFEPIVIVHQDGMLIPYLCDIGVPFFRAPGSVSIKTGSIEDRIRYLVSRILFLQNNKIDIVHTNDNRMHNIWGLVARLAGVHHIRHERNKFKGEKEHFISLIQSYSATKLPSRILTISEYCLANLPDTAKEKSRVLINPFDTLSPQPNRTDSRQFLINELGCSRDSMIVGFVSNLYDRKRPHIFVQIANEISKSANNNVFFPIFGDKREPSLSMIETMIKKYNLEDKCILMGPRFPIEPYMAACDVLVAPAVREPFGRTLVESMLVGTPVIAADDGGHREIIEHGVTGLLVQPDNPHAFTEAILYLLDNPTVSKRISDAAKRWAKENCSIEEHAQRVQEVYRELLQRE